MTAGQSLCLIVRTQASPSVSGSASMAYGLVASTAFTGTSRVTLLRNDDAVNVSDQGDVLEYRIILSNPGANPATQLSVFETIPAYTALSSSIPTPVTVVPGVTYSLVAPVTNVPGYSGPIEWSCPGTFPPGAEGSVTFQVQISP